MVWFLCRIIFVGYKADECTDVRTIRIIISVCLMNTRREVFNRLYFPIPANNVNIIRELSNKLLGRGLCTATEDID